MDKVIDFERAKENMKKRIKEGDIDSLFLGLVKIVKKWAISEIEQDLKTECEQAKKNFYDTLKELHSIQILLKEERVSNYKNLEKIDEQQKQICYLLSKLGEKSIKNTN